jgi:hypothetical protein
VATQAWIESAAHQKKPTMADDIALNGQHLLHTPTGTPATEATERADAAWMNRRLANRHQCGGLCDAPEHAGDVAAGLEFLEALGLIPYRYETGENTVRWCGRCKRNRPAAEFDGDTTRLRGGPVVACCRSCAEARRAAKKKAKTA